MVPVILGNPQNLPNPKPQTLNPKPRYVYMTILGLAKLHSLVEAPWAGVVGLRLIWFRGLEIRGLGFRG